jgi:hypothetical protein
MTPPIQSQVLYFCFLTLGSNVVKYFPQDGSESNS